MGMAHVPEGRRVFAELSVYENLRMGAYTRKDKAEIEETLKSVYKRFPRLQDVKPDGGNIKRRRTADARYGARAYVQTEDYFNG